MSLKIAAQHLASQGRGGDSTLVHMTPREVAGLDALARRHYGRGLTTNPNTGLPEAGILAALLPAIAGIALAATGVGAPVAALMVGGGTALATGSLQKGLMAGLGAFGGAGMGDAIAGMGTSAAASAPSAAAQAIGDTAMPAAESAATFGDAAASGAAGAASDAGAFESGFPAAGGAAAAPSATTAATANYVPFEQGFPGSTAASTVADQTPTMGASFDKFKSGIGALGDKGGFDQFVAAQGGGMKALSNGALALSPALGQMGNKGPAKPEDNAMVRPYNYDPATQRYTALTPYKASDSNTLFHYAQGGDIGDPRYMQGPGDGVSDSIPATVQSGQGGARPARLGDGEFVVPARIVSEIGNGSSDAGARKLYSMMDRVQQARRRTVGRDGIAVNSGADRMLPV